MKLIVGKKTSERGILITITDKDILGKTFEEGDAFLDLSSNYYSGEEMEISDLEKIMKNSYMLIFTGAISVQFAIKHKLISEENVLHIQKIPHAQCVMIG
ncbi:DUF424 family protein [Candidatus Woesearchaeota archaeon]|jgi:uncharacterized protein|nr:DUF424 family protein [Candidatus Woesearchaeota archaeon]